MQILLLASVPSQFHSTISGLAHDKGASNRLTTLPIDDNGFTLHKGAFHDAIMAGFHLTYPRPALVEHHSVDQALFCPFGGFPSIRHSEIRDLTANLMAEVCHNVSIASNLQPTAGETFATKSANTKDVAQSDIACS